VKGVEDLTSIVNSMLLDEVVCHQKIREFEKRLMITCVFGEGEGN